MDAKTVREIFKNLPPKRKQVLLRVLADDSKQKIACELCDGSEDAVQQNLRQLYKNFHIDGDRERKQPALIKLFARCMPELLGDRIPDVLDGVEQEEAIAKRLPESGKAVDTSVNDLCSEQGVDYTRLWELLVANRWLEADRETLAIMLKVSGREKECWLREEDIQKISCQVLRTIDHLWVEYSQKRFGFSVQQKLIRLSSGDTHIETWLQFALRVGWRKNNNLWLTWLEIEVKRQTLGGNIAEQFPVGFFPYQYSFRSKFHPGPIGDLLEPTPVSAYLLLERDF